MDEQIINSTVQNCKQILSQYYGARLRGVILYGSIARGAGDVASDYEMGSISLYRNARREGVAV